MATAVGAQATDLGHGIVIPDDDRSPLYTNELHPSRRGGFVVNDPAIIEAHDAWISLGYAIGATREEAEKRAIVAAAYGFNMMIVTRAFSPEKTRHFGESGWKLVNPGDYTYRNFVHDDGTAKTDVVPTTNGKFIALTRMYLPKFSLETVRARSVAGK